jgi:hypothetical protein
MAAVSLYDADLTGANLTNVNLWAVLFNLAALDGADLTGADLTDAIYLGTTTGSAYYDAATDLTNAWDTSAGHKRFDPVAAGWTLVPEPSTALLVGLGLVALGLQRRHRGNPPHRL